MKKRKKHKREIRGFTGETAEEGNSNKKESIASWEKQLKKRATLKLNEGLDGKDCREREQQNIVKGPPRKIVRRIEHLNSKFDGTTGRRGTTSKQTKITWKAS